MHQFYAGYERFISSILVLFVAFVLWELAVRLFDVQQFVLPPPSLVFIELWSRSAYFLSHSAYTLGTTLAGFALAFVIGIALAVAIVYSRFLERTLYTFLVALNSIPKVALAPLFVIWLGTEAAPKIAIAMLIALFPIVIDTVLGLRSVDPDQIDLARTARSSQMQILMKIRFPNALASIFAGTKVAISFALVGAIVGEFVAGDTGLGHVILTAQGLFDTPSVFAAIVMLGVMGTLLFYTVDLLERWLIPWHVSQRVPYSSTDI